MILRLSYIYFSLFFFIFLVVGLKLIITTINLSSNGIATEGICVDLVVSNSSDSDMYYPVVEFITLDGERIETKLKTASSSPYKKGETISILYLPDSPKASASIDSFFLNYIFPLPFLSLGLLWGLGVIFKLFNGKDLDLVEN